MIDACYIPAPSSQTCEAEPVVTRVLIQMEDLLKNTTLYQEFLAEREEIMKHKWIESERAGYDIGFERALTDWIVNHRAAWRRWRRSLRALAAGPSQSQG